MQSLALSLCDAVNHESTCVYMRLRTYLHLNRNMWLENPVCERVQNSFNDHRRRHHGRTLQRHTRRQYFTLPSRYPCPPQLPFSAPPSARESKPTMSRLTPPTGTQTCIRSLETNYCRQKSAFNMSASSITHGVCTAPYSSFLIAALTLFNCSFLNPRPPSAMLVVISSSSTASISKKYWPLIPFTFISCAIS